MQAGSLRIADAGQQQRPDECDAFLDRAGPGVAEALAAADLVDEYQEFVHPVILGGGTPFCPTLPTASR